MKQVGAFVPLVVLFLLLVSACSAGAPAQDIKLAPASSLPPAMRNAPTNVREAYQFALANQDTLKHIPCYCGCGAEGHQSVKDCFVQDVRPDGTIVWDTMGLG
ncbi:MAG: PCYCGC domain-containing protein [Chloroflexi bacterium]|nr:PCYCGC domain-containing protein [Chloroflexota bacterium]